MTQTMVADVEFIGLNPEQITRILLDGQWVTCKNATVIQFSLGEHSSNYYPALRYTSDGQTVITPLSRVSGFQTSTAR